MVKEEEEEPGAVEVEVSSVSSAFVVEVDEETGVPVEVVSSNSVSPGAVEVVSVVSSNSVSPGAVEVVSVDVAVSFAFVDVETGAVEVEDEPVEFTPSAAKPFINEHTSNKLHTLLTCKKGAMINNCFVDLKKNIDEFQLSINFASI